MVQLKNFQQNKSAKRLFSCQPILFSTPQPSRVKSIASKFRGSFTPNPEKSETSHKERLKNHRDWMNKRSARETSRSTNSPEDLSENTTIFDKVENKVFSNNSQEGILLSIIGNQDENWNQSEQEKGISDEWEKLRALFQQQGLVIEMLCNRVKLLLSFRPEEREKIEKYDLIQAFYCNSYSIWLFINDCS